MFRRKMDVAPHLSVQVVVSGAEPGSYFVEIANGRCISGQGELKEPNLTSYCTTDSWSLVGCGDLTPEQALDAGRLRITGSAEHLSAFFQCFSLRRRPGSARPMSRRDAHRVSARRLVSN